MREKNIHRIIIITGGIIDGNETERTGIKPDDFIICADSGADNTLKLGLSPDLIIGDMDSVNPENLNEMRETGREIIAHPAEKDESDTELALIKAVEMNPEEILIIGASGGRADHFLCNIMLLCRFRNANITLINPGEKISLARKRHTIDEPEGTLLSLIPLSDTVDGISLTGCRYPLREETLHKGSSRGLSNILSERPALLTKGDGDLLLILNLQTPGGYI